MNEKSVSHIEQTLCLVHTFSNRHVCSCRHFSAYCYSCFSHFFFKKKILLTTSLSFCAIVLQVEFVGVLLSVQLRRNEIRSILGDDCPLSSVQIEGQIRLKDTTLSLGSDMLFNYCLYFRFVFFIFFWFLVLERTRKLQHSQFYISGLVILIAP